MGCEERLTLEEECKVFERQRAEVEAKMKDLNETYLRLAEKLDHRNGELADVFHEVERSRAERRRRLYLVEKSCHEKDELARREESAISQLSKNKETRDLMKARVWQEIGHAHSQYVATEVAKRRAAGEQKCHLEEIIGCATAHSPLIASGLTVSYLR